MNIRACTHAASRAFGVTVKDIRFGDAKARPTRARQCAMWLARIHGHQWADIGHHIGGRDHSTAHSGAAQAMNWARADKAYRAKLFCALALLTAESLIREDTRREREERAKAQL